jgi:hypothetical protein
MANNQPQQCDICFQSYGTFSTVCILPVTPIISLSGTATPIHVRIPDTRKIICHHCRQSYSNLEPWTEPETSPPAISSLSSELEIAEELSARFASTASNNHQPVHDRQDAILTPPIIFPISIIDSSNVIPQQKRDYYVPTSFSCIILYFGSFQLNLYSLLSFRDISYSTVSVVTTVSFASFISYTSFQSNHSPSYLDRLQRWRRCHNEFTLHSHIPAELLHTCRNLITCKVLFHNKSRIYDYKQFIAHSSLHLQTSPPLRQASFSLPLLIHWRRWVIPLLPHVGPYPVAIRAGPMYAYQV